MSKRLTSKQVSFKGARRAMAGLVSIGLLASACAEEPASLRSETAGPVSTTTTIPATTTTEATTTTTEAVDEAPVRPANFGAVINVNTVDDFEEGFNYLVELSKLDNEGTPFIPLPNRRTGQHNDLDLSYYSVNEGMILGSTADASGTLTAHVVIFDPEADNFSEVMATYVTLVLPGSDYIGGLVDFIQDSTADTKTDTFGPHEVQLIRSGVDAENDPIFVMSIVATEDPQVDHRNAALALAEAASESLSDEDSGTAAGGDDGSGDVEPVSRQRAAERDLIIDACELDNNEVRLTGRVVNNGTIKRVYLVRIEVYDTDGERVVPGAFGDAVEPGATYELDETYDLGGGNWDRCEAGLIDPTVLGGEEFPTD